MKYVYLKKMSLKTKNKQILYLYRRVSLFFKVIKFDSRLLLLNNISY